MVKISPRMEKIAANKEPHFKKKDGSVFPKKKRSVKRMIAGLLFSSIASVCCKKMIAPPKPSNPDLVNVSISTHSVWPM